MEFKVYGHSDDLIEVEGDVSAEYMTHGDVTFAAFSDGTLLRAVYDGGMWTFRVVSKGSASEYEHHAGESIDDDYSDIVTIRTTQTIEWVLFGETYYDLRDGPRVGCRT